MTSGQVIVYAKRLSSLLVLACGGVLFAAENAITTADRSVVRVIVKHDQGYSSGTGFVVGSGGVVATNRHVVAEAGTVLALIKKADGKLQELPATVTWTSADYDLALLKVPGLDREPLLISDQLPGKGSPVTAIGYPGVADRPDKNWNNLVESTVTQGIIGRVVMSSWKKDGQQLNILQHSAAVNSGNSGGPLLDSCGRLIGVNTGKALGEIEGSVTAGHKVNQSDGIFYASHAAVLIYALQQQSVTAKVTSEGCPPNSAPGTPSPPAQAVPTADATVTAAPLTQAAWVMPGAIGAALLLALGALVVAMKKSVAVRETFTQYKRRTEPQKTATVAAKRIPKCLLRGRDSSHHSVEFLVDPAECQTSPLIIGRGGAQCQLVIDDPTVSRRHASLLWAGGRLQLTDLGSTNGTWLDGASITTQPVALRYGQTLTLGKVVLTIEAEPT